MDAEDRDRSDEAWVSPGDLQSAGVREFGERLRACRLRLGVAREAVARDLGVPESAIIAWECGARFPKGAHLDLLSAYLEEPLCALLYGCRCRRRTWSGA